MFNVKKLINSDNVEVRSCDAKIMQSIFTKSKTWNKNKSRVKIATYIVLDRDAVQNIIPYAVVCEAHESSAWNTGRRKRRWDQEFTKEEKSDSRPLFAQARDWYLRRGVPEQVKMQSKTLALWQKLGEFCSSL